MWIGQKLGQTVENRNSKTCLYHAAVLEACNVDSPKNLAKLVIVDKLITVTMLSSHVPVLEGCNVNCLRNIEPNILLFGKTVDGNAL